LIGGNATTFRLLPFIGTLIFSRFAALAPMIAALLASEF
jgi:hypothetical protein